MAQEQLYKRDAEGFMTPVVPEGRGRAEALRTYLSRGGGLRKSGRYRKGPLRGKTPQEAQTMFEDHWAAAPGALKDKYAARARDILSPSEKAEAAAAKTTSIEPTQRTTINSKSRAGAGPPEKQTLANSRPSTQIKPTPTAATPTPTPAATSATSVSPTPDFTVDQTGQEFQSVGNGATKENGYTPTVGTAKTRSLQGLQNIAGQMNVAPPTQTPTGDQSTPVSRMIGAAANLISTAGQKAAATIKRPFQPDIESAKENQSIDNQWNAATNASAEQSIARNTAVEKITGKPAMTPAPTPVTPTPATPATPATPVTPTIPESAKMGPPASLAPKTSVTMPERDFTAGEGKELVGMSKGRKVYEPIKSVYGEEPTQSRSIDAIRTDYAKKFAPVTQAQPAMPRGPASQPTTISSRAPEMERRAKESASDKAFMNRVANYEAVDAAKPKMDEEAQRKAGYGATPYNPRNVKVGATGPTGGIIKAVRPFK